MIEHIATAAVYVEDQEQSLDFWTKRVGFTLHRDEEMALDARWIEVGPEGARTHLVLYPKALMEDWEERRPSIVFQCEDIEGTVESLRANGVEVSDEIRDMRWSRYATFKDLDGNEFLLKGELGQPST